MEEPIQAKGIVTEDDYIASFDVHLRHSTSPILRFSQKFYFGLLILMTLTIPMVIFGDRTRAEKLEALLPMTGITSVLWGIWFWSTRRWRVNLRKSIRAIPEELRWTEWTLGDEFFESRHAGATVQQRWSMFSKVVEAPVGFLVYDNPQTFSLLPAHAFASAEAVRQFAELARSRVSNYVVLGECRFPDKPKPVGLEEL